MAAFNLATFPEVCRLCLQSKHPDELVPIDCERPAYGHKLSELLEDLTFEVSQEIARFLPTEICDMCLEVFDFFYKYKQKITYIHRFLVAFTEVKLGNVSPLRSLFEDEYFSILLKDLDLCNKDELLVEDMLDEYPQYKIASMPMKMEPAADDYSDSTTTVMVEMLDVKESFLVERLIDGMGEPGGGLVDIEAEPVKLVPVVVGGSEVGVEEAPDSDSEHGEEIFVEEMQNDVEENSVTATPREVFQCNRCRYKTTLKRVFEAHCRVHERNEHLDGVHCARPSCLRVFPDEEQYQRHLLQDDHKLHVCDICGATLRHKHSLEIHLARHTGVTNFQCQYCSSSFFTKTELGNHVKSIHTAGDLFRCPECNAGFKNNKLLKQHQEIHVKERQFKCLACEFAFKTKQHLKRHVVTVHQERRFNCEQCQVAYGRKDKLRTHMERVHNIQSHFTCDICLRFFNTAAALEEHRGHHANPKPLECARCLIAHQDRQSFDDHLCISYREDYICCEHDFKTHVHYNRHMLQKHGERTNVRVRPSAKAQVQRTRKQMPRCRRCKRSFESVAERRKHVAECRLNTLMLMTVESKEETLSVRSGTEMGEEEHLMDEEEESGGMMMDDVEYVVEEVEDES